MKIALLTDGVFPSVTGGIQKHSFYFAKYLSELNYRVDIYTRSTSLDDKLEFESSSINSNFVDKKTSRRYPGHYIRESYVFSRDIFSSMNNPYQYDFVYAQGFTGWYYGLMRKKDKKLPPLITNFHGLEMFQKAASFKEKLKQLLFKRAVKAVSLRSDVNCSLGGQLTPILQQVTNGHSTIIETPIGIGEDWLSLSHESMKKSKRSFVFLGRYERRKGIEELSAVLSQLPLDFDFHFIGPIEEDKQIASEKVYYHGLVKDESKIKDLLRNSDVLVCPSYSEGMPTVILEAMASGCAIIASDVGAVSEQVDDANGILIKPGNKVQLSDAIVNLIKLDDSTLVKMKKSSIERVNQKFVWNEVIQQNLKQIIKGIES
ncbi:glycosyltransferase family 4 protein [Vibrio sp. 10N.261.51.C6]|uniref:glycosyltransferase family 4 protein n=1 Tax=Vibrio sp. 10N.261.51.C6 TaxID=3229676 RepID=UPI00354FF6E2